MNNTVPTLLADPKTFQRAVADASDHIIITDTDGNIIFANKAAELITGYSVDEMIGNTPRLWGGLMDKTFYQQFWTTLKTEKKPFYGEITNKRKNGEIYHAILRAAPILNENNTITGFVATEEDITERVRIDKAKSEFVSLASHQLRTPLTVINWYTEMLINDTTAQLRDDQIKYLTQIQKTAQGMTGLVTSLLNVSRIELGTFLISPEIIDCNAFIQNIINGLSPLMKKKNITVEISLDPAIRPLSVDQNLLRIILENLLINACTYTPENGKITVITSESQENMQITVRDTGLGIPENARSRLFTKFFRADNAKTLVPDGNGLGLYIVKSILDACGGTVRYESQEGKGTTFIVTLSSSGMKPKEGSKMLE